MTRHWESMDFTIQKIVKVEGDISRNGPRFGSKGTFRLLRPLEVTGVDESLFRSRHSEIFRLNEVNIYEFKVGYASTEVDRTLDKALKSFFCGEEAELSLRVKIDSNKNCKCSDPDSIIWCQIELEIRLESFEDIAPIYEWTSKLKSEHARELTSLASSLFKEGRYWDAFVLYRLSLPLVIPLSETEDADIDVNQETNALKWNCLKNMTACQFQWRNYKRVIQLATMILDSHGEDVKSLYRRGVAYSERNEFEDAKRDLNKAASLDPSNKAVQQKRNELHHKIKSYNAKMRSMFQGL